MQSWNKVDSDGEFLVWYEVYTKIDIAQPNSVHNGVWGDWEERESMHRGS